MSEVPHLRKPAPANRRRRVIAGAAAVVLGAGAVYGARGLSTHEPAPSHPEQKPKPPAEALADRLNETITSGKPVKIEVLNGVITVSDQNNTVHYIDPIVFNKQPHPDARGNFLTGTSFGLQSDKADGHIYVQLLKYDPLVMQFHPNSSKQDETYKTLDVRAFTVGDGQPSVYRAFAVDPQAPDQREHTPAGDFVMPGYADSQK